MSGNVKHARYPHEHGMLYDCPACESNCYCAKVGSMCVGCALTREGEETPDEVFDERCTGCEVCA